MRIILDEEHSFNDEVHSLYGEFICGQGSRKCSPSDCQNLTSGISGWSSTYITRDGETNNKVSFFKVLQALECEFQINKKEGIAPLPFCLIFFNSTTVVGHLEVSLSSLLEQWNYLETYTIHYYIPCILPACLEKNLHFKQVKTWNMVLLSVELFFSIPILNAKVERMFPLMKNGENRFSGTAWPLVRIWMEGSKLKESDHMLAIQH